jgi:hypothetical protein
MGHIQKRTYTSKRTGKKSTVFQARVHSSRWP